MYVKGAKGKKYKKTCLRKKLLMFLKHQQFFIEICTKVTMICTDFQ